MSSQLTILLAHRQCGLPLTVFPYSRQRGMLVDHDSYRDRQSKGRRGQSTLTVHLAVAALRAGQKVAILDTDPQGSAAAWGEVRVDDTPPVVAIAAADIASALAEARSEDYDVANLITAADWALIPVRPSVFDITTAEQTQRIVIAAGTPFAFVLNACPARAPEIAEGRAVLMQLGPVLDVAIGERRVYGRALQTGQSVQEFDAQSDAAIEIERAWSEIERRSTSNGAEIPQGIPSTNPGEGAATPGSTGGTQEGDGPTHPPAMAAAQGIRA
jgi:chromosome partitioning protein